MTVINSFSIRKNLSDGMGYVLSRIIGSKEIDSLDPFLLFDETKPDVTENSNYEGGFPLHPHRGIQILSYTFSGKIIHADSLGNSVHTKEGDLIWMLAGKGAYHSLEPEERPSNSKERIFWHIFFWINLPQKDKYLEPQFKYIPSEEIPIYSNENLKIKVLSGTFNNLSSPLQIKCMDSILILDLTFLPIDNNNNNNSSSDDNIKNSIFNYNINSNQNSFIHILYGEINFNEKDIPSDHNIIEIRNQTPNSPNTTTTTTTTTSNNNNNNNNTNNNNNNNNISNEVQLDNFLVSIKQQNPSKELRLLFCVGQRTDEPIVKFGPYAMNTQQEIHQCFLDFGQQ